jgi:hypothetical protein
VRAIGSEAGRGESQLVRAPHDRDRIAEAARIDHRAHLLDPRTERGLCRYDLLSRIALPLRGAVKPRNQVHHRRDQGGDHREQRKRHEHFSQREAAFVPVRMGRAASLIAVP